MENTPLLYIASSWSNREYPEAVRRARQDFNFAVHDWRDKEAGGHFQWDEISLNWKHWSLESYLLALGHSRAEQAFEFDMAGLEAADAVLYLQPSGVSAAIEAAYAHGKGKPVVVCGMPRSPDLMLKIFPAYKKSIQEALEEINLRVNFSHGSLL